jgi:anti-sigma B factor antagonist
VREETSGDTFVLTIEGELDLSSAPSVREPLERAIEEGTRKVVIDMLNCTFVDSTGLGVMLHSAKRLEGEGGMAIVCTDEQIRRLLGLTMIDRTIPVFSTREDATAHLGGAATRT